MSHSNKKIIFLLAAILIAAATLFAVVFFIWQPQTSQGDKLLTILVTDQENTTQVYETYTDAQYLRQALEDTEDLTFSGTEGQYGLMIDTVNGLTADWSTDQAWWSIYINNELANYSIDQQPVADGDTILLQYTTQADMQQ